MLPVVMEFTRARHSERQSAAERHHALHRGKPEEDQTLTPARPPWLLLDLLEVLLRRLQTR